MLKAARPRVGPPPILRRLAAAQMNVVWGEHNE
jgi:hypothetical protein